MRRYFIMMSVRVVCFVLMVAVTPYGWHTWLFAAGAVVLPYVAVVVANVSGGQMRERATAPERAIEQTPATQATPAPPAVIRIRETPREIDPS